MITYIIIGIITLTFLVLSIKSNILKDSIDNPSLFLQVANKIAKYANVTMDCISKIPAPYSLSRTQFGLWTIIIASSYIYLVIVHGCAISLEDSKTALEILGISSGTTLIASTIDDMQSKLPRHQNSPS